MPKGDPVIHCEEEIIHGRPSTVPLTGHGSCWVWSDPHVVKFDGATSDFNIGDAPVHARQVAQRDRAVVPLPAKCGMEPSWYYPCGSTGVVAIAGKFRSTSDGKDHTIVIAKDTILVDGRRDLGRAGYWQPATVPIGDDECTLSRYEPGDGGGAQAGGGDRARRRRAPPDTVKMPGDYDDLRVQVGRQDLAVELGRVAHADGVPDEHQRRAPGRRPVRRRRLPLGRRRRGVPDAALPGALAQGAPRRPQGDVRAHGRHVRRRRGAAEGRGEADGVDAGARQLADEAARGRRRAVLQLRVQVRVAHADGKGDEGRRHVRRAHRVGVEVDRQVGGVPARRHAGVHQGVRGVRDGRPGSERGQADAVAAGAEPAAADTGEGREAHVPVRRRRPERGCGATRT